MVASSPLLDFIVSHFDDPKPNGTGVKAKCPCHDDRTPSLSISLGDDGKVLVKCHAGCEAADIVAKVGLGLKDLYPQKPRATPRTNGRVPTAPIVNVAPVIYDYTHETGSLLYQVERQQTADGGKTFRQFRLGADGKRIYNLDGVQRVIYRWPDVRRAIAAGEPILFPEGEQDVLRLVALGYTATTTAGGAKGWKPAFVPMFAGADVPLFADHDQPGYARVLEVHDAIAGVANAVEVIQIVGLPKGSDVSDFLDRYGDRAVNDIKRIVSGTTTSTVDGDGVGLRTITRDELTRLAAKTATPPTQPGESSYAHMLGEGDAQNERPVFPVDVFPEVIAWPDRQELPASASTPTLPDEFIPEPLRTWMCDMADISRLPLEMIAAPAIVGLGAIIGRSIGIRPWNFNDFIVAPNLWGCVVSRPGWMKSFAVAEGLKPIGRLAAAAHDDYEVERESAEAKTAVIESVMDDLKRRMRAAAKDDDDVKMTELQGKFLGKVKELKEASPTERRYMTHDATIEKLAELLRDNPKGMLVVRDELYGLLRSFEKSGRENDRQFYLEGWDGTGSFTSDRIARGTIHVPALTLSIIGSIQPGRLRGIVDEAAAGGGGDDGLLQRFQVTVWPDRLEPWVKPSRWPNGDARDTAFGIFEALDAINPFGIQAKQERAGTIPYLPFTAIAQGVADEWHDELEHRLRSDILDASPAFASHLAKYRSLMPSLALLFHLVDIAAGETSGGPVSEGPTKLAAAWCDFLEAHARKVYDVELDRGKSAARSLATKIQAAAIIDGQTVRDIYRHQWSGLKSDEIVIDGLKVLADHGWVRLESVPSGPTGGRSSQVLRLHPTLMKGAPS